MLFRSRAEGRVHRHATADDFVGQRVDCLVHTHAERYCKDMPAIASTSYTDPLQKLRLAKTGKTAKTPKESTAVGPARSAEQGERRSVDARRSLAVASCDADLVSPRDDGRRPACPTFSLQPLCVSVTSGASMKPHRHADANRLTTAKTERSGPARRAVGARGEPWTNDAHDPWRRADADRVSPATAAEGRRCPTVSVQPPCVSVSFVPLW